MRTQDLYDTSRLLGIVTISCNFMHGDSDLFESLVTTLYAESVSKAKEVADVFLVDLSQAIEAASSDTDLTLNERQQAIIDEWPTEISGSRASFYDVKITYNDPDTQRLITFRIQRR